MRQVVVRWEMCAIRVSFVNVIPPFKRSRESRVGLSSWLLGPSRHAAVVAKMKAHWWSSFVLGLLCLPSEVNTWLGEEKQICL